MKTAKNTSFEVVPWVDALPADSPAATSVRVWWATAQKVYPRNTLLAWACDWGIYAAFCEERGFTTVPASAETIAAFIEACGEHLKKPATIRRYLSTIALAHRVAKFSNPCVEEPVRLALKGLTNEVSVAQRQAKGVGWKEIKNSSSGRRGLAGDARAGSAVRGL
jgi:hypothetical protein